MSGTERRKDCKKCGGQNVPFGLNRNTYDGLSYWCRACMRASRIRGYEGTNWSEVNRRRRSDPVYRQREREQANQRDLERRLIDPEYVRARSESEAQSEPDQVRSVFNM
jgi:hypothetical protein